MSDTYTTQEILSSKKYQNLTPDQRAMFIQTFGNRGNITSEQFNSFVTQTSNMGSNQSGASNAGTIAMASPLALPVIVHGVKYLYNTLTGKVVDETGKELTKEITKEVTQEAVKQGATQLASQGATQATQIGSTVDGGAIMSDGTIASPSMAGSVMSNLSSLGAVQGAGVGAGVLGGAYLLGNGLNDLRQGKTDNSGKGIASRLQTGITTGGISEGIRALGLFKPKTEVEDKKLEDLKKKGLLPKDYQINHESRSREQQLKDLQAGKGTGNADWLKTGDKKYLTAQDIQGYAGLIEKEPDPVKRLQLAQKYVDATKAGQDVFNEHHGTIDFKDLPNTQPVVNNTKPAVNSVQQTLNIQPPVEDKKKMNLNDLKKLWR